MISEHRVADLVDKRDLTLFVVWERGVHGADHDHRRSLVRVEGFEPFKNPLNTTCVQRARKAAAEQRAEDEKRQLQKRIAMYRDSGSTFRETKASVRKVEETRLRIQQDLEVRTSRGCFRLSPTWFSPPIEPAARERLRYQWWVLLLRPGLIFSCSHPWHPSCYRASDKFPSCCLRISDYTTHGYCVNASFLVAGKTVTCTRFIGEPLALTSCRTLSATHRRCTPLSLRRPINNIPARGARESGGIGRGSPSKRGVKGGS